MSIVMKHGELISAERKKVKIMSVSKNDSKSIWTFRKSDSFIPSLLQFLIDMGFSLKDFEIKFFFGVPHEDDEELDSSYITYPFSKKYFSVNLFDQDIFSFNKKDMDIDVIFFSNKICLITRTNKNQNKLNNLISKFASFDNKK